MEYTEWRDDLFGQPQGIDIFDVECRQETYQLSPDENLEHVNRMLEDQEIHQLYSRDQIGVGLQLIFDNTHAGIAECYIHCSNELMRLAGIRNIRKLYENYFARYCTIPITRIGYDIEHAIDYHCHMQWEILPLYRGGVLPDEAAAILDVLRGAIEMSHDHCIVSAIHGLGHWVDDEPRAAEVLEQWLRNATTTNPVILEYAHDAKTGYIQ